jgi:chromosome segregation ATPase
MDQVEQELQDLYQDLDKLKLDNLKPMLSKLCKELVELKEEKEGLDKAASKIAKSCRQIETSIRHLLEPVCLGVVKTEIKIDDHILEMKNILNVTAPDKEQAIDWLKHNNYKDVLKETIHPSTLKKIASELHEEGTDIPGLNYTNFNKISIKNI